MTEINGYSIKCSGHNYVTLYYNGEFVHCFDNDLYSDNEREDEYFTEHIIATIEKRTGMKITEIPIIGKVEDFDGLRFLNGGFKKGSDWLKREQEEL